MLARFRSSKHTPVRQSKVRSASTHPGAESFYAQNVLDHRTLKGLISNQDWQTLQESIAENRSIPFHTADSIANALLKWSKERGVTHYAHWFQPINNGVTAEKHDTFLELLRDGETPISRFGAKQLLMGEPDGSSFPSGGLRATHSARGYTCWDPHSNPFVLEHDNGATLYIPSLFFSWKNGTALDEKVPLLRSEVALQRETLRLFQVLGDDAHFSVHCDSGLEQEFFLIDRSYYLRRPDLIATGRTLLGASPPKGQQLEDQYFGHVPNRMLTLLQDLEDEAWKLGIPIQTRHREVAPGQYEVAPRFARVNQASDRNLILMEILRKVARRHDCAALLHEKPFKGVNGSGKHNNWSVGSNHVPSLFYPGKNPAANSTFMFFLAATIRGVDLHGDLMRVAISGAGNDHRLGANEAPPAIVSAYLGDDVLDAVERFIKGNTSPSKLDLQIELGIPSLVGMDRAATDRNRTSTFAFTGNKFEFRAVGSSHNPSRSNQVLNTIVADSIREMTTQIEKLIKAGKSPQAAMEHVSRETLEAHKRVVFNDNGYSAEWQTEAARRGLPNLKTTPEALKTYNSEKNRNLYTSMKVLSPEELEARSNILYEEYIKKICIEGKTVAQMALTQVAPVAFTYQKDLARSISALDAHAKGHSTNQTRLLASVGSSLDSLVSASTTLRSHLESVHDLNGDARQAEFCEKEIIPLMSALRAASDSLETVVPASAWPLPTYHEMLFHQD